jgi:ATP/maltotriose-dependent transcriptional regulator MalT
MYTRRLSTLGSWLAAFPEPVIQADPWLGIVRLHQMWSTGRREGLAERALESRTALQDKISSKEMSENDAELHYEWNLLEEAEQHLNTGLALIRQGGLNILLISGLLNVAWLKHSRGDLAGTLATLENLRHECRGMDTDTYEAACRDMRVRCLADQGELEEVATWLEGVNLNPESTVSFQRSRELLLAVRCLALLGRSEQAMRLLDQLKTFARHANHSGMLIQVLLAQVIAWEMVKRSHPSPGFSGTSPEAGRAGRLHACIFE